MRLKCIVYTAFILFLGILQGNILENFKVFNVKANVFIVFIVSVAMIRKKPESVIIGFIVGLVHDAISGKMIGFYTILGMYLAIGVSYYSKKIYKEGILVAMFFTLVASIVYETVVYFTIVFWNGAPGYIYSFSNIIFPETLINIIFAIVIHFMVVSMSRFFDKNLGMTRKY